MLNVSDGNTVSRRSLEEFLEEKYPGRFSKTTLKSTAQNINATWTSSDHLAGRVDGVIKVVLTTWRPGSIFNSIQTPEMPC